MSDSSIVVLGRIAGSYGIKGWLRLHPFGDDPQEWGKMPALWLAPAESGNWQEKKQLGFKAHGAGWLFALEGVDGRDAAEALKGWLIGAPREALPDTGEGEYYWADLVGMRVVNATGESLGEVQGLIETGANEVLQVLDSEGQERLLPFVKTVVLDVDVQNRQIQVDWGLDW